MPNYNICSDCEVNNGCNVTCSTGNFTNSPSLVEACRSRLGAVDEVAIQAMPLSVIAI